MFAFGYLAQSVFGNHDHESATYEGVVFADTPLLKLQRYTSPDGQYVASVCFKYDVPKYEDHFWTFLTLSQTSDEYLRPWELTQPIRLMGSSAIECEWVSNRKLIIRYHGNIGGDFKKQFPHEWRNVEISYVKWSDPPS